MPTTKRMQESTEGFANIDRDAGVIRGVKVLGLKSRNHQGKREYLREAASKAVSLYEGRKIYIDHVKLEESAKSRSTRSTRQTGDRWGKLINVAPDDAGELRGDLHYIKTHPMTEQILEAAERFNDFGLSHDASGKVQEENGREVVYELTEVHSVDIVQDPATNKNLFESVQTMKKNLRAVLRENIKQSQAPFLLARLTEMADIYDDAMEMEVEPETSPEDQVKEAFKTAIMAILDGDYTTEEQIAKIKMLLDVQTELAGGEGAAKKSTPPTDGESPMTEAEVKALQAELTQLKEEKRLNEVKGACTRLLEEVGREVTDVRVRAMAALADEADRKLLAESFPAKGGSRPTHSPSKVLQEQNNDPLPATHEDFKKLLGV